MSRKTPLTIEIEEPELKKIERIAERQKRSRKAQVEALVSAGLRAVTGNRRIAEDDASPAASPTLTPSTQ